MWYALLVLVSVDIYTVDSVHTSKEQCLSALVTEHRGEGMCTPVEIRFPELLPEMGPAE
jgi:hypothetical protein